MLSVVVPTIWAHKPFLGFLSALVELNCIDEVIIINNMVRKTPDHSVLLNSKVKVHNMGENIYVNPAWNLGVSLSKNERVCLLSDDVHVDLRLFIEVDRFMPNDAGMVAIGISHSFYELHTGQINSKDVVLEDLIINGDIEINEYQNSKHVGAYGSLFFVNKSLWIDIPKDLKINFGDRWVFDTQNAKQRKIYSINNCFYFSPWCASKNSEDYAPPLDVNMHENFEHYNMLFAEWEQGMHK